MKYHEIQTSGISVSEIGFGVWTIAEAHRSGSSTDNLQHILRYAVDRGINFFETADVYGMGAGEELLGNALFDERDRVRIASRFGYAAQQLDWTEKHRPVLTAENLKLSCEKSLKRLRTDRIDLYQLHHPNMLDVEKDDLFEMLEKLKKQGKILSWGAVFDETPEWVEEAKYAVNYRGMKCLQADFDLLNFDPGTEFLEFSKKKECAFLARMGRRVKTLQAFGNEKDLQYLAQIEGLSLWQVLIKFSLWHREVASVLLDLTSEQEINEVCGISEMTDLKTGDVQNIHLWQEKKRSLDFQEQKTIGEMNL